MSYAIDLKETFKNEQKLYHKYLYLLKAFCLLQLQNRRQIRPLFKEVCIAI